MTTATQEEFSTFDLGLAAALVSLGFNIDRLDKASPSRVLFVFPKNSQLDGAIQGYWSNEISVAPQEYFNSIKSLKNRIYSRNGTDR